MAAAADVTPLFSLRENAIAKEPGLRYAERWRCVCRLGAQVVVRLLRVFPVEDFEPGSVFGPIAGDRDPVTRSRDRVVPVCNRDLTPADSPAHRLGAWPPIPSLHPVRGVPAPSPWFSRALNRPGRPLSRPRPDEAVVPVFGTPSCQPELRPEPPFAAAVRGTTSCPSSGQNRWLPPSSPDESGGEGG